AAAARQAAPVPTATMARDAMARDSMARESRKQAARNEAEVAADIVLDAPAEDIPPATMDAPAAREAWLQRIRELQQKGRLDEARASLAEFRRRYPPRELPADLRALEPPPPPATPEPPVQEPPRK